MMLKRLTMLLTDVKEILKGISETEEQENNSPTCKICDCIKEIDIWLGESCPHCWGSGKEFAIGDAGPPCSACDGTGLSPEKVALAAGNTCPGCGNHGGISMPCRVCGSNFICSECNMGRQKVLPLDTKTIDPDISLSEQFFYMQPMCKKCRENTDRELIDMNVICARCRCPLQKRKCCASSGKWSNCSGKVCDPNEDLCCFHLSSKRL